MPDHFMNQLSIELEQQIKARKEKQKQQDLQLESLREHLASLMRSIRICIEKIDRLDPDLSVK